MSTLDDKSRARLIALLGMLGSDHAGERDNAAQQAEALRKKLGMSWEELFASRLLVVPKVVYVDRPVVVEREVIRIVEVWLPYKRIEKLGAWLLGGDVWGFLTLVAIDFGFMLLIQRLHF